MSDNQHKIRYHEQLLKAACRYCRAINRAHYENFPVASILLPRKLRPHVDAIYAFSRVADDFSDEPEFDGRRLELLTQWESFLSQAHPTHPIFVALKDAQAWHDLPLGLFLDLIRAFKQDVVKNRYENFSELLDYCRCSANPVGRLVLHIFGKDSDENLLASDKICTALQLANFWQDVAVDLEKDRVYLPREDLVRFDVSEDDLFAGRVSDGFAALMKFEIGRTRQFFVEGARLGENLKGRLGIEIRLTWLAGMRILQKIEAVGCDVYNRRPVLKKSDCLRLLPQAFFKTRFARLVAAMGRQL